MITLENLKSIPDKALSGNKISGGSIELFSSTGIVDLATKTALTVADGRIVVDAVRTKQLEGDIGVTGGLNVAQKLAVSDAAVFSSTVHVDRDLTVAGELRAVTLYVDNLVAKTRIDNKQPFAFSKDEGGVEGKGFVFKHDAENIDIFVFKKDPNRIFTTLDIDLQRDHKYRIDGVDVLTQTSLGQGVTTSNLKKVGRLKQLEVDGNVVFGEHIFFDYASGRTGFGTDSPSAAVTIADYGVDLVLGANDHIQAFVGTSTSHDLHIVTDNVARIKLSKAGKIVFGDEVANNADVRVHGKLFVKELVVDQRQDRTGPLEFRAPEGATNYGRGMIFTGNGHTKQFILAAEPDNFFSSEHINLKESKGYFINNRAVLSSDTLGSTVTKSSLKELGTLKYLSVNGNVNFSNVFEIKDNEILLNGTIKTKNNLSITGTNIALSAEYQTFEMDYHSIKFGNKEMPIANVIVNGKLGIGVQSVDSDSQLEIGGNFKFANKLFMTGITVPTSGTFKKGDIVWSDDPKEGGNVGWVCVRSGTPGIWRKFGQIGVD